MHKQLMLIAVIVKIENQIVLILNQDINRHEMDISASEMKVLQVNIARSEDCSQGA